MDWHKNTKALVTGGGQGLGLAIAHELVAQGCTTLTLADMNEETGQAAADALSAKGVAASFNHVNMADTQAAIKMVEDASDTMGAVTSLVNCAASTERGSILNTTPELWDNLLNINTKSPFFALQRFAQLAIEKKIEASAVNILSIVIHCGLPILSPYCASKAALANITKNSANTLAKHRIRVNGVNVGWMDTPGEDMRQKVSHNRPDGWLQGAESNVPFGKLVKPEEVARLVCFLLGPQSGVVTGSNIDFDQQVVGAYPDTDEN